MNSTSITTSVESAQGSVARSVGGALVGDLPAMREWADDLVERARTQGVELTADNGLLTALVRQVLQTGLNVELAEHLGYEPHAVAGRGRATTATVPIPKR